MQGAFSLMVFGWSQILMDLQPLYVMLRGEGELHGFSHTCLGAALIAPVAMVSGKYLGELGLRILHLESFNPISWKVAGVSALIGTFSHVLIDTVMHADMRPLYPFSDTAPFHGSLSISTLHLLCLGLGIMGSAIYGFLVWQRGQSNSRDSKPDA